MSVDEDGPELRVAIATSIDPGVVMPKLAALCGVLERSLGRPTSGHLMISYEQLELFANADALELMWLPPLIAFRLVPSGVAHALAIPVRNGESSYATALFTRPDSDVTDLEALSGKRVAWVDRRSSAGYILPRALLAARGIAPDETFGEQQMLGAHEKVVARVLSGAADVGATYVHLKDGEIVGSAWGDRKVRVLAVHGPIPADMLACGRSLSAQLRDELRELVLDDESELSKALCDMMQCDTFALPDPSHLDALASVPQAR